jgi:Protein of unknown function (DUF3237)
MIKLDHEMDLLLNVSGPVSATAGSPLGERIYWEMTDGLLSGPRINARVAMPGGDWLRVGSDGYWRPDVRVQLRSHDDALILLQYSGLVQQTDKFRNASDHGLTTQYADQYMRMLFRFDTGSERYAWLNQHLFIAEGRLAGPKQVGYSVYRVD